MYNYVIKDIWIIRELRDQNNASLDLCTLSCVLPTSNGFSTTTYRFMNVICWVLILILRLQLYINYNIAVLTIFA